MTWLVLISLPQGPNEAILVIMSLCEHVHLHITSLSLHYHSQNPHRDFMGSMTQGLAQEFEQGFYQLKFGMR